LQATAMTKAGELAQLPSASYAAMKLAVRQQYADIIAASIG